MFPTRTKSGRKVNLTSKMAEYQETRARTKKTLDEAILEEIERTTSLIEEYEKDIKWLTMNKLEVQLSHTSRTAPAAQSYTSRTAPAAQSYTLMTAPASQSHTSRTAPAAQSYTLMTAPASQSYTSMTAPASQSYTSMTAPASQSYTSMTAPAAQSHTSMTAPAARPHTSMTAPAAQSHVSPIASVIQSNAPLTAPAVQSYATQYSAAPMTLAPPATRAQVVIPSYEQPHSRPQYELNPAVEEFMPIGYHPRHTSTPAQQYMPQPQVQQNSQTTDVLQQLVTLLSKKDHLPSMEPEVFKETD